MFLLKIFVRNFQSFGHSGNCVNSFGSSSHSTFLFPTVNKTFKPRVFSDESKARSLRAMKLMCSRSGKIQRNFTEIKLEMSNRLNRITMKKHTVFFTEKRHFL